MTYESLETSVESSRPVELYHFTVGTTHYRYTSAADEISFGGNTYFPRQIKRTSPSQATDERRQAIEITLPTEDDVASQFIGVVPGPTTYLEILRFHRDDLESFVVWSGTIAGAAYQMQGAQCKLRGITSEAAFSRPIPRFKYQGMCNHILFDTRCGVTASSFKYTGDCSAVSGNTITITGLLASKGAGWVIGGYVNQSDTDYRLVIAQSGDVLTLYLPFKDSPLGTSLDCYAGCDHTTDDCENKFNKLLRYGGFPFVPWKNPFESGM